MFCLKLRALITLAELVCDKLRVLVTLAELFCDKLRALVTLAELLCDKLRVLVTLAELLCDKLRVLGFPAVGPGPSCAFRARRPRLAAFAEGTRLPIRCPGRAACFA